MPFIEFHQIVDAELRDSVSTQYLGPCDENRRVTTQRRQGYRNAELSLIQSDASCHKLGNARLILFLQFRTFPLILRFPNHTGHNIRDRTNHP
jgi:hypothetical protein